VKSPSIVDGSNGKSFFWKDTLDKPRSLSASLDPGKPKEDEIDLEETLSQILERVHDEPPC
jgi:hypothetical protein